MIIESINLIKRVTERDNFVPDVMIEVDGQEKIFLLDTGAAMSCVVDDQQTQAYASVDTRESSGASGIVVSREVIQFERLRLGAVACTDVKMRRGGSRNFLGIDVLGTFIFQIDLQKMKLNILDSLPAASNATPIRRLNAGHVTIPILIKGNQTSCLFDTGADMTVIDREFIVQNRQWFDLLRTEDGEDGNGHKIDSEIYSCANVEVGGFKVTDVEMAAFDFGPHLRERMEGTPIILGNNVISKATWTFDLKSGHWMCAT